MIEHKKAARGVKKDTDLKVDDLRELVGEFRELIRARVGRDIPQDPREQLWMAIGAVFDSWHNDRAITYRRINNIPGDWGTAVTVQSMVFGNLGDDCATGVAFTRDPGTGEKGIYGEFLPNAQGEDVVAGIRTGRQNSLKAGREWAGRAGIERGRTRGAIMRRSKKASRRFTRNCCRSRRGSKSIFAIRRTWNSRSSAIDCSCCRRATASGRRRRRFESRSIWRTRS